MSDTSPERLEHVASWIDDNGCIGGDFRSYADDVCVAALRELADLKANARNIDHVLNWRLRVTREGTK